MATSVVAQSLKMQADVVHPQASGWSLEGDLQAHSVAGAASPWMGISAAYRFSPVYQLGARGFLPVSKTVDKSTYALQAFARVRLRESGLTDLFLEPDYALDFYNFVPFTSYGLALGAMTWVRPKLAVGLMGGLEFAHDVIDSIGLEKRNDLIVYPKIALLANFPI